MTDKPTPTDAELFEVIREAARGGAVRRDGSTSLRIARAVLAKWGQPAQAAEPVAVVVPCYTPSGKRVALYSAKEDLPIGTKLYAAHQPSPTAQTDSLQEDAARLDWLESTKQRGHYCGVFSGNFLTRESIDAARAAQKEGEKT